MGRCSLLTDYVKGRIEGMRDCGTSLRKIASQIGRSHNVVNNYLKNKSGNGKKKKQQGGHGKCQPKKEGMGRCSNGNGGKAFKLNAQTVY